MVGGTRDPNHIGGLRSKSCDTQIGEENTYGAAEKLLKLVGAVEICSDMPVVARITHTLNVVEPRQKSYFNADSVVTKYVIQVVLDGVGREQIEWQVARRYSHFRSNHAALMAMFPALKLPRLPPKVLSISSGSGSAPDPEMVATRMVALDAYLRQLLATPAIGGCTQMRTFLGAYHGMQPSWFEDVNEPLPLGRLTLGDDDALLALTFGDYASSNTSSSELPPTPQPAKPEQQPPPVPSSAPAQGTASSSPAAAASAPLDAPRAIHGSAAAQKLLASSHDSAASSSESAPSTLAPYAPPDARAAAAIVDSLGLAMSVDSFAAQFEGLGFLSNPDAAAAMAQRFLNGMEAAIAVSSPPSPYKHCAWRTRAHRPAPR